MGSPFAFSVRNSVLVVRFASGFQEQIRLGQFRGQLLRIARSTRSTGWWSCRSPNFPRTLSLGCYR